MLRQRDRQGALAGTRQAEDDDEQRPARADSGANRQRRTREAAGCIVGRELNRHHSTPHHTTPHHTVEPPGDRSSWLPEFLSVGARSVLRSGSADPGPDADYFRRNVAGARWLGDGAQVDGFRLLVAVDQQGRVRAWSRRGTSLGGHLGPLLAPLAEALRGSVVDGELVALSSCDGRAVQDFGAVCRAALQADAVAASKLHLVAFDLLELGGEDIRSLPWVKRTELLRESFPAGERLRLVQTQPASRAAHDQLVALGFRGLGAQAARVNVSPRSPARLAQVQGQPPCGRYAGRRPPRT
jgi:hypothetical protein